VLAMLAHQDLGSRPNQGLHRASPLAPGEHEWFRAGQAAMRPLWRSHCL